MSPPGAEGAPEGAPTKITPASEILSHRTPDALPVQVPPEVAIALAGVVAKAQALAEAPASLTRRTHLLVDIEAAVTGAMPYLTDPLARVTAPLASDGAEVPASVPFVIPDAADKLEDSVGREAGFAWSLRLAAVLAP